MTQLFKTLCEAHDWALDRADYLFANEQYKDGDAIMLEFQEWLDPSIEEHDVFSFTYQGDNE